MISVPVNHVGRPQPTMNGTNSETAKQSRIVKNKLPDVAEKIYTQFSLPSTDAIPDLF